MHHNSFEVFRRFALPYFQPGMKVLEVGPDPHWSCKSLLQATGTLYHFADMINHASDQRGFVAMKSEYVLDSPDALFDIVFSANVIEHVRKPWLWMAELARITRVDGLVVCVNPVSWPYHAAPVDCWRLLPEAYKALFEEVGLEHSFSWHGNLVPIDPHWAAEHGPQLVTDTIAIGRKHSVNTEV